jgi:hypothetical protein
MLLRVTADTYQIRCYKSSWTTCSCRGPRWSSSGCCVRTRCAGRRCFRCLRPCRWSHCCTPLWVCRRRARWKSSCCRTAAHSWKRRWSCCWCCRQGPCSWAYLGQSRPGRRSGRGRGPTSPCPMSPSSKSRRVLRILALKGRRCRRPCLPWRSSCRTGCARRRWGSGSRRHHRTIRNETCLFGNGLEQRNERE